MSLGLGKRQHPATTAAVAGPAATLHALPASGVPCAFQEEGRHRAEPLATCAVASDLFGVSLGPPSGSGKHGEVMELMRLWALLLLPASASCGRGVGAHCLTSLASAGAGEQGFPCGLESDAQPVPAGGLALSCRPTLGASAPGARRPRGHPAELARTWELCAPAPCGA